jgi:hypothetical protein
MKFFRTIKDVVYNPGFYLANRTVSFKRPFAFILKLSLLASLVIVIVLAIWIVPVVIAGLSPIAVNTALEVIPPDLQVTITHGQASINKPEPYIIPIPEKFRGKDPHLDTNLLVIDTTKPFDPTTFYSYKTVGMLTKEYLVVQKNDSSVSFNSIKNVPDQVISRSIVRSWIEKVRPYVPFLLILGFVLGFIAFFVAIVISKMFALLIYSFIAWIIIKTRKMPLSYGQIYRLGLYVMGTVIILNVLGFLIGVVLPWYVNMLIFLLFLFLNLKEIDKLPKNLTNSI